MKKKTVKKKPAAKKAKAKKPKAKKRGPYKKRAKKSTKRPYKKRAKRLVVTTNSAQVEGTLFANVADIATKAWREGFEYAKSNRVPTPAAEPVPGPIENSAEPDSVENDDWTDEQN